VKTKTWSRSYSLKITGFRDVVDTSIPSGDSVFFELDPLSVAAAVFQLCSNKDVLFGARLALRRGKIYDIEATGLVLPYGPKTGWE
jgi:hypothetical protein